MNRAEKIRKTQSQLMITDYIELNNVANNIADLCDDFAVKNPSCSQMTLSVKSDNCPKWILDNKEAYSKIKIIEDILCNLEYGFKVQTRYTCSVCNEQCDLDLKCSSRYEEDRRGWGEWIRYRCNPENHLVLSEMTIFWNN